MHSQIQTNRTDTKSENIKSVLKFLKSKETKILSSNHKEVVIVLGITGSGKSTLVQFLAGNNNDLLSREVGEDTGEFIIIDKDNKISNLETIHSKTEFPELFVETKTCTAYYDCPGFSDTRDVAHDIATSYFIKRAISFSESVKLVFTVDYSAVRVGVDRQGFLNLLKHISAFIKNIDRYENAIALVVTKVENSVIKSGRSFVLVSDEKIINKIGNFLNGIREEFVNNPIFLQDEVFRKKAIKLLDIFLSKSLDQYTKIVIFRRPDETGKIITMDILQTRKALMIKTLTENLKFVTQNKDDFAYTISDKTKVSINELKTSLHSDVAFTISDIFNKLKQTYQEKENDSNDIQFIYDTYKTNLSYFVKSQKDFKNISNLKKLVQIFSKIIIEPDHYSFEKNFKTLSNYQKYFDFLKDVNNVDVVNFNLSEILIDFMQFLKDSSNYYCFLVKLNSRLQDFDMDSKKKEGIIEKSHANRKLSNNILNVKFNDTRCFINVADLQALQLNDRKILLLENVLKFQSSLLEIFETRELMRVKGNVIKLSEIYSHFNKDSFIRKRLEIFATVKFFVDVDFVKVGDKLEMFVLAPIWEIVGQRKIVLDGKSGQVYKSSQASNGSSFGQSGSDGLPGNPGGSAGTFFGIGETFINGSNLLISADGGNGSSGQDGGDGYRGQDGETPLVLYDNPKSDWDNRGFYWSEESHFFTLVVGTAMDPKYIVQGKRGSSGGNGGHGGVGGVEGHHGEVILINLGDKHSQVFTQSLEGKPGRAGFGGRGGLGGRHGDNVVAYCHYGYFLFFPTSSNCYKSYVTPQGSAVAGISGNDNYISKEFNLDSANRLSNLFTQINYYKLYLIENLHENIQEDAIKAVLENIDTNPLVQNMYNTLGYIDEIESLENSYFQLKNKIDLLPFYESLKNRVEDYSKKFASNENKLEYKKAISFVYTAILSKISSINSKVSSDLIINLKAYLDVVTKNIEDLQNFSNNVAIKNYNDKFKQQLNLKTMEATDLIDIEIVSELNAITAKIDEKIKSLIDEIVQMKTLAEEEKRGLKKKQTELKNAIGIRKFLDIVGIGAYVLNFLGPLGTATSGVINGGLSIAKGLMLDESNFNTINKLGRLPHAIKNFVEDVSDHLLKEQQKLLNNQLYDIGKGIDDFLIEQQTANTTGLSKMSNKIVDLKLRFKNLFSANLKLDFSSKERVDLIRIELIDLFKELKVVIKKKDKNDEIMKKQVKFVNKLEKMAKLVEIPVGIYNKIKDDEEKLDVYTNLTNEANNKIDYLNRYEKNIYKTTIPLLKNMENMATKMNEELVDKSHVVLDLQHWQVQSFLKDIKFEIKEMTRGLKTSRSLIRFIEKFEEALITMIKLYDMIQVYNDKAELATYIANINSKAAVGIQINNLVLKEAINKFNMVIFSSLVLEQYEKSFKAFAQYAFPFVNSYLEEFSLPSFNSNNSTSYFISVAVQRVKKMQLKLLESDASITGIDKYIHSNVTFGEGTNLTPPFMVWRNREYGDLISQLLRGKEITLKADITKGIRKNAIKFNSAEIYLRVPPEIQKDLDEKLLQFRVSLTHSGHSYLRCGKSIYLITSDKQFIRYSFKKNSDGDPVDKNEVYSKLKNSKAVLSPYTLWNVQLLNSTTIFQDFNSTTSFEELKMYENLVDLELIGRGQYVDTERIDHKVCNKNLNRYYDEDNSIVEADDSDDEEMEDDQTWTNELSYPVVEVAKRSIKQISSQANQQLKDAEDPNTAVFSKYISLAKSSGNSISKASFINRMSSWVHSSFLSFNNVNTVKDYLFNWNTHHFINQAEFKNPNVSNSLETQSFTSFNEFLLLTDFAIRSCVTGKKYARSSGSRKNEFSNSDHAQNLAYRNYRYDKTKNLEKQNTSKISEASEYFSLTDQRSDFCETGRTLFTVPNKNNLNLNAISETPLLL